MVLSLNGHLAQCQPWCDFSRHGKSVGRVEGHIEARVCCEPVAEKTTILGGHPPARCCSFGFGQLSSRCLTDATQSPPLLRC